MAGYLTTHVLDTARGCPAVGLEIWLYRMSGNSHRKIADAVTNADGRTDQPILPEAKFKPGGYELVFRAGAYLNGVLPEGAARFLGDVPIRFEMDQEDHYHVPLLLSPYGYSTYRGS
ncbi:hydroxyisourate hydrolase [Actibacterium sp. 188UL27-1]|uniref:hydroxyisourate hydrolase n=1 Tax=Actibacterium sp. 188UL27-1 TaxID=2786961 RepID=UPI0019578DA9|nr:hydroxyisourate hydrolase [Actibacterium sp. 188UL27-1]MBM7068383.1 hydroxyisourate hydrolase [Actibacterium sp. 188UL27-1]